MPLNTRNDGSNDDRKLTRALAGKELSPWLLKLMGDRALPLASRSRIHATMPTLAFSIWRQVGHLGRQSSRMVRRVTDYAGLTSLRATRRPVLPMASIPSLSRPVIHSPAWWRMLNFIWLRQRQRRQNEFPHRVPIAEKEQLVSDKNMGANEFYTTEFLQTVRAPKDKRIVTVADKLYSKVIRNLHPPYLVGVEPPDTTGDLLSWPHAASVNLQARELTGELEAKDAGWLAAPHTIGSGISSIYQANQSQKPDRLYAEDGEDRLTQVGWQQPASESRWPERFRSLLPQILVPYRSLVRAGSQVIQQVISQPYVTAGRHWPHLIANKLRPRPDTQVVRQDIAPYITNIPEIMASDEEVITTVKNFELPVDSESGNNLLYSPPDQIEPVERREAPNKLTGSSIAKIGGSFEKLRSKLPKLSREPMSGSPTTNPPLQQRPEINQARRFVPLVMGLPELVARRAKTKSIPEDSGSVTHGQVTVAKAAPDIDTFGQGFQIDQAETPLTRRESPSVADLQHPQPSAIKGNVHRAPPLSFLQYSDMVGNVSIMESIDQMAALSGHRYFKLPGNAPPPNRSESYRFLWEQDFTPSPPRHKDARPPTLELLHMPSAKPRVGSKSSVSGESLLAAFSGTAFYDGSQMMPELALAPAERPAEVAPPAPPRAEVRAGEDTKEAAAPDIDSIARDVYSILKRRLAREKERALGVS